ncbi:hypothetical protein PROFUN_07262 [Planoprotostelium fungivorum]|uniref:Enoyl-CoA hydratase n=1 Tax=Planoprotostelium fungivorum TaxID=1890364 RepID=A0A2P6NME6_9EUKA|nr:hypothetical protein PROFUN_07262 [Planoprotostelium fungivorum]
MKARATIFSSLNSTTFSVTRVKRSVPLRQFRRPVCSPASQLSPCLSVLSRETRFIHPTLNAPLRRDMSSSTHSDPTSPPTFEFLRLESDEKNKHLVRVVIERTAVHNAFNEQLIAELTSAFRHISSKDYRCCVITGAGSSFSAGADLNWMKRMASMSQEENKRDSLQLFDMIYAIKRCPFPVIARINGAALGGGSGIVAACDIGYSIETATFGFTEVKIGLIPAVISPFVMEKIGRGNCSHYFLTGRRFGASEAKSIGLIQESYKTPEELDAQVERVTAEICSNGPQATRLCKDLISKVCDMSIDDPETKEYVARQIASARASPEGKIGLSAFLEKKKPDW